ncbi:hypothetical protein CAter282_0926 [Collimonas arenae]|uniref:Uncharacterized protein n=1 Tax=Collimonas arenae TaxID=279058 RepID=A0A127PM17_9BURK|nr:hypothetical protein CAter10_1001 [Collimonas arenae]AMP08726.1 hypothetical protein CAter282_0926 [Collimonas arenae]
MFSGLSTDVLHLRDKLPKIIIDSAANTNHPNSKPITTQFQACESRSIV